MHWGKPGRSALGIIVAAAVAGGLWAAWQERDALRSPSTELSAKESSHPAPPKRESSLLPPPARERATRNGDEAEKPGAGAAPTSPPAKLWPTPQGFPPEVPPPDLADQQTRWFEPPPTLPSGHYVSPETPLVWDSSCSREVRESFPGDFESFILRQAGVQGTNPYPPDLWIHEFSHFWIEGTNEYHQASATWEMDEPATYRVSHVASRTKSFSTDVKNLPLARAPNSADRLLDAVGALAVVRATWEAARARGAREGARVMLVAALGPRGGGPTGGGNATQALHKVHYLNAQPVQYHGQGLDCFHSFQTRRASCFCSANRER